MTKNQMFLLNIQTDVAKWLKGFLVIQIGFGTWRFGQLNFGALASLGKKKMVRGSLFIDHPNQLCERCLFGKQFRKSFPKEATSRAMAPLQLVHSDVCGPIKSSSFGKNNYFSCSLMILSKKLWSIFLKKNRRYMKFSRNQGFCWETK